MRGGISYIPKRHSKVNIKCIKLFDDSKSSKYNTYLKNIFDMVGQGVNIFLMASLDGYRMAIYY